MGPTVAAALANDNPRYYNDPARVLPTVGAARHTQTMKQSLENDPASTPTKKLSGFARFMQGPEDPALAWFDVLQVFKGGRIGAVVGDYKGKRSAAGFTVELVDGEELSKRVTFTRLVATGVFAFALKKKRGGEKWLMVEGPGAEWMVEVPKKKHGDALKFVQAFRKAVREAEVVAP